MRFIPNMKLVQMYERSTKEKTDQAPIASPGKRLKATVKVAKTGKKKQLAQGLKTLSEISLSEAEQMKILPKNQDKQIINLSRHGSSDEDDDEVSISKDDDDDSKNEDDDGQDDDKEQTKLDNDGDDFVHPKLSTHDEEERQEEEGSDLRVQTPSHFESTDDETYDEVTQGDNVEGEELDEEETNEEEEVNELQRLSDRDPPGIVFVFARSISLNTDRDLSNMLNPNLDTGIDSILNLNTESTSLADVPVTTNVEMRPSSVTTLPPPPIPLVQPQQQTPITTPTIVPSTSLQNLPTFGSLFKFEDRVKALEDDFSEFKQTNQFAEAVSLVLGIVDEYLANQMNEAVKAAVQL
ncbi:hypothetical protein Tco_0276748 [Tanacetum coccineum]